MGAGVERFYNFKSVELVRIGTGPARIVQVAGSTVQYTNASGAGLSVDLEECAQIYQLLNDAGLFPPDDKLDWATLADAIPGFSTLYPSQSRCVGLRGALDTPPWFQFLNRRRTQFEFKDYDAFQRELRRPLGQAGWNSWDAC
jgi:hypothetical protein